jgi:cyanophycin synthetase
MTQGAVSAGCSPDRILGIRREEEAVTACLHMARPGDLVVLTPTRIASVWAQVQAFTPALHRAFEPNADRILEPPHG